MNKKLAQTQNFKKEVKVMKRIISLCISLALIFSMVQAFSVQAAPNTVVNIPDVNLRQALLNQVDYNDDGQLTESELADVFNLYADNVSDLTGLQYCDELHWITLSRPAVSDWSILTQLTGLDSVELSNITDISFIPSLTNLSYVSIEYSDIADWTPLAGATNLSSLQLFETNISDISAISGLTNLSYLSIYGGSVTDWSPIAGLTNLSSLRISNTDFADSSVLSALANLEVVDLSFTPLSDLSVLQGFPINSLYISHTNVKDISSLVTFENLSALDISGLSLSDYSVLESIPNLWQLQIIDSGITDVSAFANLNGLGLLALSSNQITDVSPLAGLSGLYFLDLGYNQLEDITPLASLTSLDYLYLDGNNLDLTDPDTMQVIEALEANGTWVNYEYQIIPDTTPVVNIPDANLRQAFFDYGADTNGDGKLSEYELSQVDYVWAEEVADLSGLEYCTNLDYLSLYNSTVSDFSAMAQLPLLYSLNLYETSVTDLSFISALTNLKYLSLGNCQITDISALATLTNLESLSLYGNQITDVSALAALTNLESLDLGYNQITDISALSALTKLDYLYLGNNKITDISALASLANLGYLSLYNNQVTDVSPLAGLSNLYQLVLWVNQIADITPLASLTNLEYLDIENNGLNLDDPAVMQIIETFLANGATVWYQYQDITGIDNTPIVNIPDENLKAALLKTYDSNWDGELSERELSGVTNLSASFVSDLSGLEYCNKLVDLSLYYSQVSNYSILAQLPAIKSLNLYNLAQEGLAALSTLTKPTSLGIYNSYIADLSPLTTLLKKGFELDISKNYFDTDPKSDTYDTIQQLKKNGVKVKNDGQSPLYTSIQTKTRLSGNNRVDTALEISKEGWADGEATAVVLASGSNFADALAGGPFAASKDAPILLTTAATLEEDVKKEIARLGAKDVYILGGESSVNNATFDELSKLYNVERLAGGNRYVTAVEIAKALVKVKGAPTEFFLASGTSFPDALSISPVAAIKGAPILFANPGQSALSEEASTFVKTNAIKSSTIVGGTSSVNAKTEGSLASLGVTGTSRISGSNRYITSDSIYRAYKDLFAGDAFTVATGASFPDALAGSSFAAKNLAPVILLHPDYLYSTIRFDLRTNDKSKLYIFGGTSSVSNSIVTRYAGEYVSRVTLRSTFTTDDWMTALTTLAAEDSGVNCVNVADTGDDNYRQDVITEFLSGDESDVLYYWMGDYAKPLIDADKLVSIEEIQQDYPNFIADHDINRIDAVGGKAADGKHYFVPSIGYSEALLYNKAVLDAAGVSVPDANTTYEQWVEDLKKVKDAGYTALATVFDPAEGIHYLWEYTSFNNELDASQHGAYTKDAAEAAAFAAGLDDIKALYDNGLLSPDADTITNSDTFFALIDGNAAFFVGGSWSYNVWNENVGITYFPAKAGSNRKNTDAIGGISMGYAISRKAYEDPEKRAGVVALVQSLTSAEALLSFGEWRTYTLSASAVSNKTRAYTPNFDWTRAKRIADLTAEDYDYYPTPLTDTLKSALAFNTGITMFQGAVQDEFSQKSRAILFGQSANFFNGTGTAADLIAAVNAA
ncbi:MAG: leucine-rich repeat domain-containing protein [Oscillospiraceae bacterium]|jgi:internalin A|nr:leucine-rich repeat domain-containing protein [Oscillospiraceae bacterium]